MTTAETPEAAIDASSACRAGASGVVRTLGNAVTVGAPSASQPAGAGLDGADQARALPGGGEAGLDQVGRGRLAVRAGDADDGQLPAGLAVDAVGDRAEDRPRVVHDADRKAGGRGFGRPAGSVRTATAPRCAASAANRAPCVRAPGSAA